MTHPDIKSFTNDKEWQLYFEMLRSQTFPTSRKYMLAHRNNSRYDLTKEYYGESPATRYANFINDVLHNIRKGNVDYVFFVYQIEELLKFETSRLWTEYLPDDRCFMVGLHEG